MKACRDSILSAKRRSGFCEFMESFHEASRFCRILAKNPDSTPEAVRLPGEEVVSGERCLVHLLETNFLASAKRPKMNFGYGPWSLV